MNGWIKKFADGTEEVGTDQDIGRKLASWSRGRLDNLTSVELRHNGSLVILEGSGEFWQSDDYEAVVYHNTSTLVTRRIQKKLHDADHIVMLNCLNGVHIYKIACTNDPGFAQSNRRTIHPEHNGMWFTLELDVLKKQIIFDFKGERI